MIPVAHHLPQAYLRPLATELPKAEPLGTPQQQNDIRDRVIEAEWRPISGAPVKSGYLERANSEDLTKETVTLAENRSAALMVTRYQQMVPQTQLQRGAILDIQV